MNFNFLTNYSDYVREQVSEAKLGEPFKADIGCKDLKTFRMTLFQVKNENQKFKTKVDKSTGELWVCLVSD